MSQVIRCPRCGHPARAGQNFCSSCAAPLPRVSAAPQVQRTVPPDVQAPAADMQPRHTAVPQAQAPAADVQPRHTAVPPAQAPAADMQPRHAAVPPAQAPAADMQSQRAAVPQEQIPAKPGRHFPIIPILLALGGVMLLGGIAVLCFLYFHDNNSSKEDSVSVIIESPAADDGEAASDTSLQAETEADTDVSDDPAEAARLAYADFLAQYPPADLGSSFADATYDGTLDYGYYINYFYLRDITGDGIPELFTVTCPNFRWEIIRVYTITDGEVTPVTDADGSPAILDDNHAASGSYDVYFCSEGHVHNTYSGETGSEETVWGCIDGVWTEIDSCTESDGDHLFSVYQQNTAENRAEL